VLSTAESDTATSAYRRTELDASAAESAELRGQLTAFDVLFSMRNRTS